jgi:hypothetical protein
MKGEVGMGGDMGMDHSQDTVGAAWTVSIKRDDFVERAFAKSKDGRIEFGWTGKAVHQQTNDSLKEWTRFSDYVMEGGVAYELRVLAVEAFTRVELRLLGTKRDQYVPRHVQFYLDQVFPTAQLERVE